MKQNLEKLENWKIPKAGEKILNQGEERLCKSIDAIMKDTSCWRTWRRHKNKNNSKMSYASMTSPARNCRGVQCAKLVNWN